MMADDCTSVGEFSVLLLITILSALLVNSYCKKKPVVWYILGFGSGGTLLALLFSYYVIPFDITWFQYGLCVALVFISYSFPCASVCVIILYCSVCYWLCGFPFSADYVFENVLEPHQQVRIKVVLGMEEDLAGAGYNVNQSKIAIGSGGLLGKGFLNGTQTKLKYVPEQDTDFIFCTVGEEEGFLGSAIVLLLFMTLI